MKVESKLAMAKAKLNGTSRPVRAASVGMILSAPLALLAQSAPAMAQTPAASTSQPVIQSLPSQDSLRLSAALSRLGRDPRDIEALIDAGNAAVAMGDLDAGVGFFKRAAQVAPKDPRAKLGMASATVRAGDPASAIPLFDEAERAGALPATMAADRGLAYDLVGDNLTAQKYYRLALAAGENAEVTRRLALSIAISGDARGVEDVLLPQLRAQDKAAWRTRAFALAILGRTEEAVKITRTILPEDLATQIAPYLRYMPQLTAAQQAAAADLGMFPRASEIGRDDPRIALYAPAPGSQPRLASVDAGLMPKGVPLGKSGSRPSRNQKPEKPRKGGEVIASAAPTAPRPERQVTQPQPVLATRTTAATTPEPVPSARSTAALLAVATAGATPEKPAGSASTALAKPAVTTSAPPPKIAMADPIPAGARAPVPATTTPASAPTTPAAGQGMRPRPGFDLSALPGLLEKAPTGAKAAQDVPLPGVAQLDKPSSAVREAAPAAASPAPAPAEPAPPPRPAPVDPANSAPTAPKPSRTSLADAFSDLGKPETAVKAAPGAVDITRIRPAKPQPKPEDAAKPAAPSHPSRIWVQLGVGRDTAALAADWRRLARKAPELFKDRKGSISDMGASNRLLAGPFETTRAANAFVAKLRDEDIPGAYVWTSPAGQVVDAIGGK